MKQLYLDNLKGVELQLETLILLKKLVKPLVAILMGLKTFWAKSRRIKRLKFINLQDFQMQFMQKLLLKFIIMIFCLELF